MLVFVYGTLKRGCSNNILLRKDTFIGEAFTLKSLCMFSYGVPVVVVPSNEILADKALPILGEVYSVSKRSLQNLDALEGHPRIYRRVIEKVQIGNVRTKAYIYVKSKQMNNLYADLLDDLNENVYIIDGKYSWAETWVNLYDNN